MKQLSEFLGKALQNEDHTCEKHGAVRCLAGTNQCPTCLIEKRDAEGCAERELTRRTHLHKISNLPTCYGEQEFITSTQPQLAAKLTAGAFYFAALARKEWTTLLLTGKHGNGKTLLACAIGRAFIDKSSMSVRYATSRSMVADIRAAYGTEGMTEAGQVAMFAAFDILIIDEFDVAGWSDNDYSLIAEVIVMRYNNSKPVIVISNRTEVELRAVVSERIMSRLRQNGYLAVFDWQDERKWAQE